MAVNVLLPLLIPLGEQITNGTGGNLFFLQSTYEVHVAENSAPVDLVTVLARSNTTSGVIRYKIVGGDEDGKFSTNPRTGVVTLNSPLDFETQNMYEVVIGAQKGHERALSRVVVRVSDVNDQAPTFARPLYETQMTEEDDRHLPKRILQVTATDGDISDRGKLRYSLSGDGVASIPMPYLQPPSDTNPQSRPYPENPIDPSSSGRSPSQIPTYTQFSVGLLPPDGGNSSQFASPLPYFAIDSESGDIQLLQPLDRDAPNGRAKWILVVIATDGLHEASTTLHVNVKDINDNAPFFPKDVIEGTVMENSPEGSEVLTVEAVDLDDPNEGTHAKLSFSLEKNVIDEGTGRPIFAIDPQLGRITTALCCLDREKTPSYAIQVVATDGGGLKGTGSVLVTIADENDVPPRFSVTEWVLSLHETAKLNSSLALISVLDPDLINNFSFTIVPNSGYGWDKFMMYPAPPDAGSLVAVKPLDFEDPKQRNGFTFQIEVSDGYEPRSSSDRSHRDTIRVNVSLVDDNDNDPQLEKSWVNLTLPEDTPVGTLLAEFPASDNDQRGTSKVFYLIPLHSESAHRFFVDPQGNVRLRRPLDRESAPEHSIIILAVDAGIPARTATATLFVTVTDVNDNPPYIKSPTDLFLTENIGPSLIDDVILGDLDDWKLGNGPPFSIELDPRAPPDIRSSFSVKYDRDGDSGRGKGIISSLKPLDREVNSLRPLPLVVKDGKGLSATITLTVTLADVNDNPMSSGSKAVTVTRIKHHLSDIPLGRIFVTDPDDWDFGSKIWEWDKEIPHPFFSLERNSGELYAKPDAKDDVYTLQFRVSDATHGQKNVPANVTVKITTLDIGADVLPAVPILISSHTPEQLITLDNKLESPLNILLQSVASMLELEIDVLSLEEEEMSSLIYDSYTLKHHNNGDPAAHNHFVINFDTLNKEYLKTEVVPVGWSSSHGNQSSSNKIKNRKFAHLKDNVVSSKEQSYLKRMENLIEHGRIHKIPAKFHTELTKKEKHPLSTTLWVTSTTRRPLDQLLLINRAKISELSGVIVSDVGVGICARFEPPSHFPVRLRHKAPRKKEAKSVHYSPVGRTSWVVDANTTALVTPKVWAGVGCSCRRDKVSPRNSHKGSLTFHSQPLQVRHSSSRISSCHPDPCLNGGRCISSSAGPKCICPEGTIGPTCKQLSRSFRQGGWAWVDPIPSCSYVHISLEFFTKTENCILLYTGPGPDRPYGRKGQHPLLQGDVLSLELYKGLPRLLLDIEGHPVILAPMASFIEETLPEANNKQNFSKTKQKSEKLHLADEEWHRLDVIWGAESVELLIDLCQGSFENCHIKAPLPLNEDGGFQAQVNGSRRIRNLAPRTPLQLGGLAYPPPSSPDRGWTHPISQTSLNGCIRNLRVNRRLYDLGKDLLSNNSEAGCKRGDFCKVQGKNCPRHSKCVGPRDSATCECHPGWTGDRCHENTIPASFGNESYVRVALSFLPSNRSTSIQLSFRTWSSEGQLILITSQHSRDQISLFLENGHLCLLLALRDSSSKSWSSKKHIMKPFTICLVKVALNDGQWHSVFAKRYGKWTELWVDSGEWPLYNNSLASLLPEHNVSPPPPEPQSLIADFVANNQRQESTRWGSEPLIVDRQEGVHIGGVPEYIGANLLTVRNDFVEGCIDDVRLDGRSIPLPPSRNTSLWAQATTFGKSVTSHCPGTPVCENVTCPDPFLCVDLWRRHHCGCSHGQDLSPDSSACQDVNECLWVPCLNGGTCINEDPGYYCTCPAGYLGDNCEFEGVQSSNVNISFGVIIGAVSWILLFLVVFGAFTVQHKCRRKKTRKFSKELDSPETGVSNAVNFPSGDLHQTTDIFSHARMVELQLLQDSNPNDHGSEWLEIDHKKEEVDVLRVGIKPQIEGDLSRSSNKPSKSPSTGSGRRWLCHSDEDVKLEKKAEAKTYCCSGVGSDLTSKEAINKKKNGGCGGCGQIVIPCDDLRNYAYEGEGNSPGSLSSCCSGNSNSKGTEKLVGGFQEVAILLNCLNSDSGSPENLCRTKKVCESFNSKPKNIEHHQQYQKDVH